METEDNPDTAEVQSQDIDSSKVTETAAATRPSQYQEQELTETGHCSLTSANKSSPFHGFSSQDEGDNEKEEGNEKVTTSGAGAEAAAETKIDESSSGHLKNQLIADFGIGQDVSEEDIENSEDSEDPGGEKDSVIKKQIINDFGISHEVSE